MFKKLWNFNFLYIILLSFSAVQTLSFFFLSKQFFYFSLAIFVLLAVITFTRIFTVKRKVNDLIDSINDECDNTASNALSSFNIPVLIVSEEDEIVWFNSCFYNTINQT